jgi:hypothetical protein
VKKELRKLSDRALTRLALDCGVLLPYQTRKEKVDAIAAWCADYGNRWQDLSARFIYLQTTPKN